jgi:LmbE family N-acetylglucosaminyl deacetylase
MNVRPFKRVLVLSPHTDDAEICCGATLSWLQARGATIRSVAFSAAEESVPAGFPTDILRTEFVNAHRELGIPADQCSVLHFRVRHFPQYRQDILEEMVKLNRSYQPDLVLLPCATDTHQDHGTVALEGFRAFKRTTIWGYESPWNQIETRISGYVPVTEEDLKRKIAAIAAYRSQQHRPYVTPEWVRALATVRGGQIGVPLAEGFEVVRNICS